MWSNVISIDKQYSREIAYIFKRLQNAKDISYATEESLSRVYIYLASACENSREVEEEIFDILEVVFLSFFKLRFFMKSLRLDKLNHAACAFLCSIIFFDREYELSLIRSAIGSTLDYNIDGLMNFRLSALKNSWDELSDVASRLLLANKADMYDVTAFITGSEGGKNRILLGKTLRNLTKRRNIEVVKLFDEDEFNLLSAIIGESPSEIMLERSDVSKPMYETLTHIARVVESN